MALYVGGTKCSFISDGEICDFDVYTPAVVITNGIRLLSFEDYVLKDMNGLYITVETIEQIEKGDE